MIVEDGSGIANANSFVSVKEARSILADRALFFNGDDKSIEPLLVKATDYIQSRENEFKGYRSNRDQALAYPRKDLWAQGRQIEKDEIPFLLKKAQAVLAYQIQNGVDLEQNLESNKIKSKTIGPITKTYFEHSSNSVTVKSFENAIASLTIWGERPFGIFTNRV